MILYLYLNCAVNDEALLALSGGLLVDELSASYQTPSWKSRTHLHLGVVTMAYQSIIPKDNVQHPLHRAIAYIKLRG